MFWWNSKCRNAQTRAAARVRRWTWASVKYPFLHWHHATYPAGPSSFHTLSKSQFPCHINNVHLALHACRWYPFHLPLSARHRHGFIPQNQDRPGHTHTTHTVCLLHSGLSGEFVSAYEDLLASYLSWGNSKSGRLLDSGELIFLSQSSFGSQNPVIFDTPFLLVTVQFMNGCLRRDWAWVDRA